MIGILASVQNIESTHPAEHYKRQVQNAGIQSPANRDPGGGRRAAESETENEMRPSRETLGIRINQYDGQLGGCEQQGQAVELRCRKQEQYRSGHRETADKPAGKKPGWNRAHFR